MNVLFWNDTLEVGGGETWAFGTALGLRARGHAVTFACPGGSWTEGQARSQGLACFDYFFDPAFSAQFLWQAEAFIREHAIDAVVCTVMGNRTEAALLAGVLRKAGRGALLLRLGAAPWTGLSTAHFGYGMEDVVRGTLVNSAFLKRQLLSRFPEIHPDRVEVLHNGVDTATLDPALHTRRTEMRQALGVAEGGVLMTAVGRLTAVKNYPMLLRAAAEVFQSLPDAVLAVVGEGEAQSSLETFARDLGVENRVRFTGFRKDVTALLHASDLFVHTSLMEGCPNAVLEAMAMGKPVVATEVGGVPELVLHGETGLLVPSGDEAALARALEGLLETPAVRRRMGEAGRRRARQVFDREAQIVRLESYLDRMVGLKGEMARSFFPLPAGTWPQPRPPEMFFARRCRRRYRRLSQRTHS